MNVIWFFLVVAIICIEEFRIRKLKRMCDYDPLTGFEKVHGFEARVLARVRSEYGSRAHAKVSAIIFIDVDHFKEVNDTHGHDAGDKILRILADIIRDGDLVVRRSGDEFIMALFGIDKSGAGVRLVEMRKKFEAVSRGEFPGLQFPVSFSFGAEEVLHSADITDIKKAIQSAEIEMYRHKRGRGMGR